MGEGIVFLASFEHKFIRVHENLVQHPNNNTSIFLDDPASKLSAAETEVTHPILRQCTFAVRNIVLSYLSRRRKPAALKTDPPRKWSLAARARWIRKMLPKTRASKTGNGLVLVLIQRILIGFRE